MSGALTNLRLQSNIALNPTARVQQKRMLDISRVVNNTSGDGGLATFDNSLKTAPSGNILIADGNGNVTDSGVPITGAGGGLTKIATVVISTPAPTINFVGIPQIYSHLKLILVGSCADPSNGGVYMQVNGDSAGDYGGQVLYAQNSGVTAVPASSTSKAQIASVNDTSNTTAGISEILIPLYSSSVFKKTAQGQSTVPVSGILGNTYVLTFGWVWANGNPITSILLATFNGYNFVAGTTAMLYGIS
jgi:hypothetical protein